jgi:hypothetical protein
MIKQMYRKIDGIACALIVIILIVDAWVQPTFSEVACATFFLERFLFIMLGFVFLFASLFNASKK